MAVWHEQLREARRARGFRQQDVADRAGISRRRIVSYESGSITPVRDTLLRLASALGLDRTATNALLLDAGFDPLPTGRLRQFERRRLPFSAMQQEIDGYAWPCLVMGDGM